MDGTKLRTILAITTSLNTALIATDLTGFDNPKVDMAYKIISIVLNFIIVALVTYFNQDYTEEAVIGTATTRRLKEDPDLPVLVDINEDEDEDDPEENWDGDDVIEEGEDDGVEQKD